MPLITVKKQVDKSELKMFKVEFFDLFVFLHTSVFDPEHVSNCGYKIRRITYSSENIVGRDDSEFFEAYEIVEKDSWKVLSATDAYRIELNEIDIDDVAEWRKSNKDFAKNIVEYARKTLNITPSSKFKIFKEKI